MARGLQGAMMRGFGAKDHEVVVVGTEYLAPHFVRVRMQSGTLLRELEVGPTAWIRLWFPDPEGSDKEFQRGYTLSEADPETGTFACDFVLHEPAGPASAWAAGVTPGTRIAAMVMGSVTFEAPQELPAGYLVLGDSASIPAINGILGAIPDEVPVELYLEEHSEHDHHIELASHPRCRTTWVKRSDAASLAAALEARDWSEWKVWAASETASLKQVRMRLVEEFGFPKSEIHARAYWTNS